MTGLLHRPVLARLTRQRQSIAWYMNGGLGDAAPQSLPQPAHNDEPSSHHGDTNDGQRDPDTKDHGRSGAAESGRGPS